jgi:hypothetical protein
MSPEAAKRTNRPTTGNSILLLLGDAEASLLADAEIALQAVFPGADVTLTRAWTTRPDWLAPDAAGPPATFVQRGILPDEDVRALLAHRHRLVIFSLLPTVAMPALRHRDGGVFLGHRGLRAGWGAKAQAVIAAECLELLPLTPEAAAALLEPVVERLLAEGTAVAVCNAFRHVPEPLQFRRGADGITLREIVRRTNLQVARLSHRTGCFVLDLDRPLAQEGGASLQADCFGGAKRAAEIALDEFAALLFDALPEGLANKDAG